MTELQAAELIASVNLLVDGMGYAMSWFMVLAFLACVQLGRDVWDDLHHKRPFTLGEKMP